MRDGRRTRERGLTLLELMIVATILAVIASIGIPQYRRALQNARIVKCKSELQTLSSAIDSFLAHEGRLPLTLYEVGFGGRLDPWGIPYCFLNYESGTGDGLDWAVDAGLVDPAALGGAMATEEPAPEPSPSFVGPSPATETVASAAESPSADAGGKGNAKSGKGSASNSSASVASRGDGPSSNSAAAQSSAPHSDSSSSARSSSAGSSSSATTASAKGSDHGLGRLVAHATETLRGADLAAFVHTLQKGVKTEVFVDVEVETTRRRDQYLYPLNTDYDLFSLGPNGRSAAALNDPLSTDDVIRANNGGYFGVAANY